MIDDFDMLKIASNMNPYENVRTPPSLVLSGTPYYGWTHKYVLLIRVAFMAYHVALSAQCHL